MKTRHQPLGYRLLALTILSVAAPAAWGCSVSTSGVDFGVYQVFDNTDLHTSGTITVDCDQAYEIRLDAGSTSTSFLPRQMVNFEDARLDYNLFVNPSHTSVWGDGANATVTVSGEGSGVPEHHTVYGRIPARQNVRGGDYADTIVVTVEY